MAHMRYFGHQDLGRRYRYMIDLGYRASRGGENCYAGIISPVEAIRGWMNSPGHRRNILRSNNAEGVSMSTVPGTKIRYVC